MDLDDVYRIDGYLSGKAICSEIIKRADDPNIIYRTNDMVLDTDAVKELAKYITRLKYENEELKENYMNAQASANMVFDKVIPVQKVKDKIEELNKKEQKLQNSISDEEREEYSDANISWDLMNINIKREVLQDLIEGRNKNE